MHRRTWEQLTPDERAEWRHRYCEGIGRHLSDGKPPAVAERLARVALRESWKAWEGPEVPAWMWKKAPAGGGRMSRGGKRPGSGRPKVAAEVKPATWEVQ